MAVGSCLCALACVVLAATSTTPPVQDASRVRRITWADTAPIRSRLEAQGITPETFDTYIERVRQETARRVREGDLDHLVFYLLQSKRFTQVPPIEPALGAKNLVESLPGAERQAFEKDPGTALGWVPPPVRSRAGDLLRAMDGRASDPRLDYFRALVQQQMPEAGRREEQILREYLRVMRFVYEKEFVAQKSGRAAEAVASLYRSRGISTDTAVEAGFLVYYGLGIAASLEPVRQIRRVLIVGPGLDLAPRTAFLDDRPLESYQPWAVIDALISLKLARPGDLEVVAADVNPRVVDHLRRAREQPPALRFVSEIRESDTVRFSEDYRAYFDRLGHGIGQIDAKAGPAVAGHLAKRVRIDPSIAQAIHPIVLDIVTGRLDGPAFDLAIATNILPYFDDVQLALAMSNIAAMLGPGALFLHNEARPPMRELAADVRLPAEQSRHAVIAEVKGATAPLFDSVWLHRKRD